MDVDALFCAREAAYRGEGSSRAPAVYNSVEELLDLREAGYLIGPDARTVAEQKFTASGDDPSYRTAQPGHATARHWTFDEIASVTACYRQRVFVDRIRSAFPVECSAVERRESFSGAVSDPDVFDAWNEPSEPGVSQCARREPGASGASGACTPTSICVTATQSALIAVDLDRTLIYSRRWFPAADLASAWSVEQRDGRDVSFMTSAAANALAALALSRVVVPATTRTVEQFRRIALPGGPYRYAVTGHGATILVDGQRDPVWEDRVAAVVSADSAELSTVMTALDRRIGDSSWVSQLRVPEQLFVHLAIDEAAMPADWLASWRDWCEPRGWKVLRQDRSIYTLPRSLCKSHAVAEVRRRLVEAGELSSDAQLLAAGDSALDAALLAMADAAVCPAHCDPGIAELLRDRLDVTTSRGAGAAAQILSWLRTKTSPPGSPATATVIASDAAQGGQR